MKAITMQPINPAGATSLQPAVKSAGQSTGFGEIFNNAVNAVNGQMQEADKLSQGLVAGEHANIHETMIAAEKAGISFRLMTKVQQKALDAYREVMRMQL
ncbi:MAG: flagellar hook-basal body complex protein FliE [Desulfobulbaceae bacterium]|nr:flagellar hook-basal body complex protein FliE [Desulfobulbaceae bacterium]HIJ78905.1 flagellar hook-basal body complex protein FliE [Deltaproteobacteria bacterium]